MQSPSSHRLQRLIILVVILFFVLSTVAITVLLLRAPVTQTSDSPGDSPVPKTRGAYAIHLIQALSGIVLTPLPGFLDRRSRLAIPSSVRTLFAVFLLLALGIGSVWCLCEVSAAWDKMLHMFSAALLTLLGAGLLRSHRADGSTDVWRTVLSGFTFAGTVGVLWEFYEYAVDRLLGLNSQRFLTSDGSPLCGQAALTDTMGDLLANTLGALGMTLILAMLFRRGSHRLEALLPGIRPARSGQS